MPSTLRIEKAAAEFRERSGYNSISPIGLKSLLIDLNVMTVFKNMTGTFSGMSLKVNEHKFMLINSAHAIGRQHFTILHEMYHLFVQENFEHTICTDTQRSDNRKEENLADLFAANVLLPKDGILKRLDKSELKRDQISINKVLELEQYFSSSHKSMLIRLNQLDLISKDFIEKYKDNILGLAQEYGYDLSLYKPGNEGLIIGDYGSRAKKLFDDNLISTTHYIELMRVLGVDIEHENLNANES